MISESKSKEVRNAMLSVVVVVLLGLVGCAKPNGGINGPDNLSDVIDLGVPTQSLAIADQLPKLMEGKPVQTIVFITDEGPEKKGRLFAFSAVDGKPRDLCEPTSKSSDYGSRACSKVLQSGDLLMILGASAANNPCSTCTAGGVGNRSCRKSSDLVTCSSQAEDCDNAC
jgi:hypothetical protein